MGETAADGTPIAPSGPLALKRNIIRVDDTPLRVRGVVGTSLYRSMRQAGVPASAVKVNSLGSYSVMPESREVETRTASAHTSSLIQLVKDCLCRLRHHHAVDTALRTKKSQPSQ